MVTFFNFGYFFALFLMVLAITGTLRRKKVQGSRNFKENDLFLP